MTACHENISTLQTDLSAKELIELVKACTSKVIVQNKHGSFKQGHAAPMGGDLSGILSDVYTEFLEDKIFKDHSSIKWKRFSIQFYLVQNKKKYFYHQKL